MNFYQLYRLFTFLLSALPIYFSFIVFALKSGYENSERLFKDFDEIAQKHRFSCGIPRFIATRERFVDKSNYEQEHSMAQSPLLDPILEQVCLFFNDI